jgi:hypothetical protein
MGDILSDAASVLPVPGASLAVSAVESLVGGGGPPDGSSSDPRIIDLNNAYNQAIQGNMGSSGYGYITTWIADQPPHPTYSNTYAQQLLSLLQQAGMYPGAPASAKTVSLQPAGSGTSPSNPPSGYAIAPTTGIAGLSATDLLIGAVAIGGIFMLASRRKRNPPRRRRRRR